MEVLMDRSPMGWPDEFPAAGPQLASRGPAGKPVRSRSSRFLAASGCGWRCI